MKTLFDETPGAVFVVRDSHIDEAQVWPAIWGIKKKKGCVIFTQVQNREWMWLSDKECDETFGDHPARGEAWL